MLGEAATLILFVMMWVINGSAGNVQSSQRVREDGVPFPNAKTADVLNMTITSNATITGFINSSWDSHVSYNSSFQNASSQPNGRTFCFRYDPRYEHRNIVNESSLRHNTSSLCKTNVRCRALSDRFISCFKWSFEPDEYECHNTTLRLHIRSTYFNVTEFSVSPYDKLAYTCIPNEFFPQYAFLDYIIMTVWIISIISLVLVIVIYSVVVGQDKQQTKPLVCHSISLICFFVVFFLGNAKLVPLGGTISSTVGLFAIRSSFTWLNVISYDMYRKFHPTTMFDRVASINYPRKFLYQSLYAWGVPLLYIAITFGLSFTNYPVLGPWYHKGKLVSNILQVVFMFFVMGTLMLVNVAFLLMIIRNIRKIRRDVRLSTTSHPIQETGFFHVYTKLIVVSGFFFVLQIIELNVIRNKPWFNWIAPLEFLSGAQGFWLLLIHCCNSSVRHHIRQNVRKFRL